MSLYSHFEASITSSSLFQPEYKVADPICTFLFSVFVLCTTVTILRDVFRILLEGIKYTSPPAKGIQKGSHHITRMLNRLRCTEFPLPTALIKLSSVDIVCQGQRDKMLSGHAVHTFNELVQKHYFKQESHNSTTTGLTSHQWFHVGTWTGTSAIVLLYNSGIPRSFVHAGDHSSSSFIHLT